ncbi:MAG: hypothetical protein IPL71_03155 [Anaerolineales bacterium]|nr:hypothetical protein [Anaerolineales bacterium]
MIPNQWYGILESNEVKKGKPIGFTRMGEKMVAWRNRSGQDSDERSVSASRRGIECGKTGG